MFSLFFRGASGSMHQRQKVQAWWSGSERSPGVCHSRATRRSAWVIGAVDWATSPLETCPLSSLALSLSQVFFSSFSFHVQDRGRVEGGYGGRESFSPLGRLRASLLGRSAPLHHTLGGAWRFSWPAGCFSVVGEPPLRALVLTSLGMNQCGLTERQGTERLASTADDRMQIVTRD